MVREFYCEKEEEEKIRVGIGVGDLHGAGRQRRFGIDVLYIAPHRKTH